VIRAVSFFGEEAVGVVSGVVPGGGIGGLGIDGLGGGGTTGWLGGVAGLFSDMY